VSDPQGTTRLRAGGGWTIDQLELQFEYDALGPGVPTADTGPDVTGGTGHSS
jgi:hypothetical protein